MSISGVTEKKAKAKKAKAKCPIYGCFKPTKKVFVPVEGGELEIVVCTVCNWGGGTTGRSKGNPCR